MSLVLIPTIFPAWITPHKRPDTLWRLLISGPGVGFLTHSVTSPDLSMTLSTQALSQDRSVQAAVGWFQPVCVPFPLLNVSANMWILQFKSPVWSLVPRMTWRAVARMEGPAHEIWDSGHTWYVKEEYAIYWSNFWCTNEVVSQTLYCISNYSAFQQTSCNMLL